MPAAVVTRTISVAKGMGAPDGQGGLRRALSRWIRDHLTGCLIIVIVLVGLGLRVHTAAASFETSDERNWVSRSQNFGDAVLAGDFDQASATPKGLIATMPGITTMLIGSVGRGVWAIGSWLNLWEQTNPAVYDSSPGFASSLSGLDVAQVTMAAVVSALIGAVMALVARWVGPIAAVVTGLLLATEPFFVAHGAILHTDELVALLGVTGLVATALVLGLPHATASTGNKRMAVIAGLSYAGALLTKLSALTLLPTAALLVAWAALRVLQGTAPADRIQQLWRVGRLATWIAATAGLTFVAAYPALWTRPIVELRYLKRSALLAEESGFQFFLGHSTRDPGITYYPVVAAWRITPWLFVAAIVAGVVIWRRASRGFALAAALMVVPTVVALNLSAKKYDRYGLLLLAVAILVVGVVGQGWHDRWRQAWPQRRFASLAGATAAAAALGIVVNSLVVSPWGIAYFNPALGGSAGAERAVTIGWSEGLERAGPIIAELEDGECDDVTTVGYPLILSMIRCGEHPPPGEPATYVIVYIRERQTFPALTRHLTTGRELVATYTVRGLSYVEIYGPRQDEDVG